jgi:sigma-E factor negative regulatory protein RseB
MLRRNPRQTNAWLWRMNLVAALVFSPVCRAEDTLAMLERMAEASAQLNYDGVFVYRRVDATDSMRLIHRSAQEGEVERLVSLTGQSREVVRDSRGVRCFLPATGEVSVARDRPRPLMPTEISRSWSRIAQHYNFSLVGEDRVAGRVTRVIAVQPRSNDRYGYRFWTDSETGLLLRSELVNLEGKALEQMEFLHLELPDHIPDSLLLPSQPVDETVSEQRAQTSPPAQLETGDNEWQVEWMPAGFSLEHAEFLQDAAHKESFRHMAYSDGLAVISVFIEGSGDAPQGKGGFASLGAAVAFSSRAGAHVVTVVGEVPPLTARTIAESVSKR